MGRRMAVSRSSTGTGTGTGTAAEAGRWISLTTPVTSESEPTCTPRLAFTVQFSHCSVFTLRRNWIGDVFPLILLIYLHGRRKKEIKEKREESERKKEK
jgi:hypothetical protein